MRGRSMYFILSSVILLSVVGFLTLLFNNPGSLLRSIFISAVIIGVIYFIARNVITTSASNRGEHRAFLKAAKTSKKRIKRKEVSMKSSTSRGRKFRKEAVHLTVIEGKKGKKKSRAFH